VESKQQVRWHNKKKKNGQPVVATVAYLDTEESSTEVYERWEQPEEKSMNCGFLLADGKPCNESIVEDKNSYSGYSHIHKNGLHGEKIDWLHWASPTQYSLGLQETERIFKPCGTCGKLGDKNEEHLKTDGHRFQAVI
jgi:hypothetical protein